MTAPTFTSNIYYLARFKLLKKKLDTAHKFKESVINKKNLIYQVATTHSYSAEDHLKHELLYKSYIHNERENLQYVMTSVRIILTNNTEICCFSSK